jgi:hypothetical protein
MIRLPIDRKHLFATIAAAYFFPFRRIHDFKLSNGDSSERAEFMASASSRRKKQLITLKISNRHMRRRTKTHIANHMLHFFWWRELME